VSKFHVLPVKYFEHSNNIATRRQLLADIADSNFVTPTQKTDLLEQRAKFLRKVGQFRALQKTYTPFVIALLPASPQVDDNNTVDVPLLLPSALDDVYRGLQIMKPFVEMEIEFRKAQLRSSLDDIRTHLFVKSRLHTQRSLHTRHQHASTRARKVLDRNERKISGYKAKYRAAWEALKILLEGEGSIGYPRLQDRDVRTMEDADTQAIRNLRKVLGKRGRNEELSAGGDTPLNGSVIQPGESTRTMSWIWMGVDTTDDSEAMREALRVEWSKCRARKQRWEEEVKLLDEEMRRVLVTLDHDALLWERRVLEGSGPDSEGVTAYALRQAHIRKALRNQFSTLWEKPDAPTSKKLVSIKDVFEDAAVTMDDDDDDNSGGLY